MTKDMTTGNPTRLLLAFSIPLLLGNIFQQLYNMVDTIIVGRGINVLALASVGSTGSINFLILGFVMGLTQGFSILIAHAFGAKDYNRLRKVYAMSIYISFVTSIVVTLISVFGAYWLLELMNTPTNIIDNAAIYIRIIFGGMTITIFFNLFSGVLRALGDSKTPLYAMILSSLVNVVLDIYFIMVLKMGVAGAAWATLIAQGISVVICYLRLRSIQQLRFKKEDWIFDRGITHELVKLGFPVALMNSVTAAGVMILQLMVNGFGSIYVAGYSAGSKIIGLVEQVGVTFGFAIATFVGQNLGAGNLARIKDGVHKCIKLSLITNALITFILIAFGRQLATIIVSESEVEVIAIAYQYIVITSSCLCVLALLFIYRASLQSLGNTFIPMISGIVELACRILVVLFIPGILGFAGVAVGEVSAWFGAGFLLMIAFYRELNKRIKQKEKDPISLKLDQQA